MIAESKTIAGRFIPLKSAALVPVDFVRAAYGLSTQRVWCDVESGAFNYVWNISDNEGASIRKRELRFLADELCAPHRIRKLSLAEVVRTICGEHRRAWSTADLSALFLCCQVHVYALLKSGALTASVERGRMMIPRASLENFLLRRRIA